MNIVRYFSCKKNCQLIARTSTCSVIHIQFYFTSFSYHENPNSPNEMKTIEIIGNLPVFFKSNIHNLKQKIYQIKYLLFINDTYLILLLKKISVLKYIYIFWKIRNIAAVCIDIIRMKILCTIALYVHIFFTKRYISRRWNFNFT